MEMVPEMTNFMLRNYSDYEISIYDDKLSDKHTLDDDAENEEDDGEMNMILKMLIPN